MVTKKWMHCSEVFLFVSIVPGYSVHCDFKVKSCLLSPIYACLANKSVGRANTFQHAHNQCQCLTYAFAHYVLWFEPLNGIQIFTTVWQAWSMLESSWRTQAHITFQRFCCSCVLLLSFLGVCSVPLRVSGHNVCLWSWFSYVFVHDTKHPPSSSSLCDRVEMIKEQCANLGECWFSWEKNRNHD